MEVNKVIKKFDFQIVSFFHKGNKFTKISNSNGQ